MQKARREPGFYASCSGLSQNNKSRYDSRDFSGLNPRVQEVSQKQLHFWSLHDYSWTGLGYLYPKEFDSTPWLGRVLMSNLTYNDVLSAYAHYPAPIRPYLLRAETHPTLRATLTKSFMRVIVDIVARAPIADPNRLLPFVLTLSPPTSTSPQKPSAEP